MKKSWQRNYEEIKLVYTLCLIWCNRSLFGSCKREHSGILNYLCSDQSSYSFHCIPEADCEEIFAEFDEYWIGLESMTPTLMQDVMLIFVICFFSDSMPKLMVEVLELQEHVTVCCRLNIFT